MFTLTTFAKKWTKTPAHRLIHTIRGVGYEFADKWRRGRMNQQEEFMNETFHVLAQPIMALRAADGDWASVRKWNGTGRAPDLLENCLEPDRSPDARSGRLARDRQPRRAAPAALLRRQSTAEICIDELTPLAEANGSALHLSAQAALIECNAPMLHRAIFVLLDEMIAARPGERNLHLFESGARLDFALSCAPAYRPDSARSSVTSSCSLPAAATLTLPPSATRLRSGNKLFQSGKFSE